MCGATLLVSPAPAAAPPQPVSVAASKSPVAESAAAAPAPDPHRAATAVSQAPASISGPSFLGLNQPAAPTRSSRKRASLSIDPHSTPGSNLEYLLDEEEPHRPWGIGKILLILIALGLAIGFGYLRFKNQGLAWLSGLKKPTASVAQNSTSTDATNTPAASSSITPETQPPAQPTPQPQAPDPNSAAQPSVAPVTAAPTSNANTPAPADPTKPTDAPKSADATPAPAPTDKAASPADNHSNTPDDSTDTPAAASTPPESSKPAPKTPAPKPSAASKPATPYDPVSEAQKYLYGRGAPHDCDRGMRLLKPQANKANPKAMVEMGALYSAGLCTPRDLPTAYRWFAMALRKDPENTALQADLTKLWGEMTQPERQLAIKMTQ
jgi:hypothetical protein